MAKTKGQEDQHLPRLHQFQIESKLVDKHDLNNMIPKYLKYSKVFTKLPRNGLQYNNKVATRGVKI